MGNHNQKQRLATEELLHSAETLEQDWILQSIQQGADVNANVKESRHNTALHLCTRPGGLECVQILLQVPDINVNIKNDDGKTPAMLAVTQGCDEILETLLDIPNCNVNVQSIEKDTCLHEAARIGNKTCAEIILRKRPEIDINAENEIGLTAFQLAAQNEHFDIVRLIVESDAVIYEDPTKPQSLLECLFKCRQEHPEFLDFIIKRGFKYDTENEKGQTLMLRAVEKNFLQYVIILHKHGMSLDTWDREGQSPLYLALRYRYFDMTKLLLSLGADVNVQPTPNLEKNPIYAAVKLGRHDPPAELLKMLDILLEKGNLQKLSPNPIDLAIRESYDAMLDKLLSKGAAKEFVNRECDNVLHLCARYGKLNLLEMLLHNGADYVLNLKNSIGMVPIESAIASNTSNSEDVAIAFLQLGAGLPLEGQADWRNEFHLLVEIVIKNMHRLLGHLLQRPDISTKQKNEAAMRAYRMENRDECLEMLIRAGGTVPGHQVLHDVIKMIIEKGDYEKAMILTGNLVRDLNKVIDLPIRVREYDRYSTTPTLIFKPNGETAVERHSILSAVTERVKMSQSEKARATKLFVQLLRKGCTTLPRGDIMDTIHGHMEHLDLGNVDFLRVLVEMGVPLDRKLSNGNTVLHHCVANSDALKFALENGSHQLVNVLDDYNASPLWLAACIGNEYGVALLLDCGVNPDKASRGEDIPMKCTPLTIAIFRRHFRVTQLLLLAGANPQSCAETVSTSSSVSVFTSQHICGAFKLNILAKVKNLEKPVGMSYTSLLLDPRLLTELTFDNSYFVESVTGHSGIWGGYHVNETGCDQLVNVLDDYFATPLWLCACVGNQYGIALLLDYGANPDKASRGEDIPAKCTPLTIAIFRGHFRVTQLLLLAGANPRSCSETVITYPAVSVFTSQNINGDFKHNILVKVSDLKRPEGISYESLEQDGRLLSELTFERNYFIECVSGYRDYSSNDNEMGIKLHLK